MNRISNIEASKTVGVKVRDVVLDEFGFCIDTADGEGLLAMYYYPCSSLFASLVYRKLAEVMGERRRDETV